MTAVRPERAFGFPAAPLSALFALVAGLSLVCPLHSLEGFAYTRSLEVPAAGRVRVPLDLGALRHMAPGGADLHVFAPDGRAVPFRLAVTLPESGRRPAQAGRPARGEGGWTSILDTGADPMPHERLVLDLAAGRPVPAVSLEGSLELEDAAWEPLATGTPVRLGDTDGTGGIEGLQRIALSYPSTPHRYLRLRWPGSASPPVIAAAQVETVPGPLLTLATQGARCRLGPSSAVCMLELPSGQVLRRLTVEIEGEGTVGYRLYGPDQARWELLAEGVWEPAGEEEPRRHVLAGKPQPIAGSTLRLELHGAGAPRVQGYVLDLAVPTVLFQASGPGRYLLAYGGVGGGTTPPESWRDEASAALWVEPGPEKEGEPPAFPGSPGASLDIRFSNTWTVTALDAEPGDLVRLELPAVVYGVAREDLGDLRLTVGGRQIPFFRWSPPDPVYAAGDPGLRPGQSERPGESRVLVSLPSEGLPLTQIHLSAPASPLRRPVTLLYVDPDRRPTRSEPTPPILRSNWECVPEPPLPCRTRLPLTGPAPRLLTVRLRDGDNPRLPSLGVSVWRRRDILLFVWPNLEESEEGDDEGTVRLLAGAADLEAPRYEIEALGPALLGHPWRAAAIGSGGAEPEKPWWNRWVMPLGVTIVAAWLVWLLRRILSEAAWG